MSAFSILIFLIFFTKYFHIKYRTFYYHYNIIYNFGKILRPIHSRYIRIKN